MRCCRQSREWSVIVSALTQVCILIDTNAHGTPNHVMEFLCYLKIVPTHVIKYLYVFHRESMDIQPCRMLVFDSQGWSSCREYTILEFPSRGLFDRTNISLSLVFQCGWHSALGRFSSGLIASRPCKGRF